MVVRRDRCPHHDRKTLKGERGLAPYIAQQSAPPIEEWQEKRTCRG
jgi:hypothetical protein